MAVGWDEYGPMVTVKMLPKPKHLDAEEVVAKVKECLPLLRVGMVLPDGTVRVPDALLDTGAQCNLIQLEF